jgi:3-oxoacyl-[acyl-carrier protein] reductase
MLKDKFAIITGGTSGIGKEIATLFAKNNAHVAIIGTNEQRAKEVVADLKKITNSKVIYKLCDISKTNEVEKTIIDIIDEFGNIDILVNNAGITKDNLLLKMNEEDWDSVIDTNLKSLYNTCKIVYRKMMKQKNGKIINVSSVVGLIGNAGQTNYSASKAGIFGFTKSLAKELGGRNVNVNAIAPGFIETKMTENLPEKIKNELLIKIPLKRLGKPQEIANAALFLASDMSDYITGQILTVDGGMVM